MAEVLILVKTVDTHNRTCRRNADMNACTHDAQRLIEEGNAIEDEGRLEEALQRYESAILLVPDLAPGHLNRGNVLLATGDMNGALEAFDRAIALDPDYAAAHYNKGLALMRCGRHGDARAAFEAAISWKPNFIEAEVALGCSLEELGELDAAMASYRQALSINPNFAEVHGNLGNVQRQLGQLEEASQSYRRAIDIKPDFAAAHYSLGKTLRDMGRVEDAVSSYRRALDLVPDMSDAHWDLAGALLASGRCDEAIASYRRVLELNPNSGEAHCSLGNAFKALGRNEEAAASYRRAIEINPGFALAHFNLGNSLKDLGQLRDAAESYRRAVVVQPDLAIAHCNLGSALFDLAQPEAAAECFRRAIELEPRLASAHSNLGNALKELGQFQAAEKSYRRALEIAPTFAEAHYNLGTLLRGRGRLHEALKNLNKAIELDPRSANAHNNLGGTLQDLGQLHQAEASYRRAMEIKEDFAVAYSNLLFCLSHTRDLTPEELFAQHCLFGERLETPLRANWPDHPNLRDPRRALRIGFVSADFRNHPVAYFVEPLLKHLAASPALILHAYHNHAVEDHVTTRLRGHFKQWQRVHRLSDAELAQKITEDGIDVLIDLSGHTAEHRLLVFARKPAPVQASWIGYPGTTGLRAMDYYISDAFLLPPGRFDAQFVEKLVHLPASAPFLPDEEAPPVNALPALTNGHITFGSFNRLSKLSDSVIDLWSHLLRALPTSRLLLCGMPQGGGLEGLIDAFGRKGIGQERLRVHVRCDTATYLKLHHQIDICLDTYPYTGGTTTNHALWMGVPTLTLAGLTPPGRQGAAVLGRVGLDAFVASSIDDYRAKGLKWASDKEALAEVRAGLRKRCAQSVTRRPDLIALALEHAFRTMWTRWCAGEKPRTFVAEVPI